MLTSTAMRTPPIAPLDPFNPNAEVEATVRFAARKRADGWVVMRQVQRDGRWYSQLHTQQPARDARDASAKANTAAFVERNAAREGRHGNRHD